MSGRRKRNEARRVGWQLAESHAKIRVLELELGKMKEEEKRTREVIYGLVYETKQLKEELLGAKCELRRANLRVPIDVAPRLTQLTWDETRPLVNGNNSYLTSISHVADLKTLLLSNTTPSMRFADDSDLFGELTDVRGLLGCCKNLKLDMFADIGFGVGNLCVRMFLTQKMHVRGCERDVKRYAIAKEMCTILFRDLCGFEVICTQDSFLVKASWDKTMYMHLGDWAEVDLSLKDCDLVLADIILPPTTMERFRTKMAELKPGAKLVLYTPPQCIRQSRKYITSDSMPTASERQRLGYMSEAFSDATTLQLRTSWRDSLEGYPFYVLTRVVPPPPPPPPPLPSPYQSTEHLTGLGVLALASMMVCLQAADTSTSMTESRRSILGLRATIQASLRESGVDTTVPCSDEQLLHACRRAMLYVTQGNERATT